LRTSDFIPGDPFKSRIIGLAKKGGERNQPSRRTTGITLLGRLGARAATAETLTVLERRFREARGDEELQIADVLGRISMGGADRLRDLILEISLDEDASRFLADDSHWGTSPGSIVDCLRADAWRRLDPAAAADWMGRAAVLLAHWPELSGETNEELSRQPQLETIFDIVEECIRQAPAQIQELAPVFRAACDPEISLRVIHLLTRIPSSGTSIAAPGSLTAQFVASGPPGKPLLERTGDTGRELLVSRLLELTADQNLAVRQRAIAELSGTRSLADDPRVSVRLIELAVHGDDTATRVASALALAKGKVDNPSPELIGELWRVVIEDEEWPSGTLPLLENAGGDVFDLLLDRLVDLLQNTAGPPSSPGLWPVPREQNGWTARSLGEFLRGTQIPAVILQPRGTFDPRMPPPAAGPRRIPLLIESLKRIARSPHEIERCRALFQHPHAAVRLAALSIVEKFFAGDASLAEAASPLAADPDVTVHGKALSILHKLKPASDAGSTKGGLSTYPGAPTGAAFWPGTPAPPGPSCLAGLPDVPAVTSDMTKILEALRSPRHREFALRSLTVLGAAGRTPGLLPHLCLAAFGPDAAEPAARDGITAPVEYLLGQIVESFPVAPESSQALQEAVAALRSRSEFVRDRASAVFGRVDSASAPAWIPSIVAVLESTEGGERSAALSALAGLGRPGWQAITGRVATLLGDPDPAVRRAAVDLITARKRVRIDGELQISQYYPEIDADIGPEIVAALCALIDNPKFSFEARLRSARSRKPAGSTFHAAVSALQSLGSAAYPTAAFTLLNLVLDDDPEVQFEAANILLAMGPEASSRAIEAVLAIVQ